MAATVAQYGWAQAEDWVTYQGTITSLYYDQNKKLKDVKNIMEQDYHFFATEKMYKTHFKKWGLQKNTRHRPLGEDREANKKRFRSSRQSQGHAGGGEGGEASASGSGAASGQQEYETEYYDYDDVGAA